MQLTVLFNAFIFQQLLISWIFLVILNVSIFTPLLSNNRLEGIFLCWLSYLVYFEMVFFSDLVELVDLC